MPNVVRFALASKTEIFVPGVGVLRNGVIDVLQSDSSAVSAVRAALAAYTPTETVVDTSAAVIPPVSLPDPYPQYLTPMDFTSDVAGGTGPLSVALRAASVALFAAELAASPDALIVGTIARDANGAATSAPVIWPDGSPGTYTATTLSTAFPGAVDAYTITYGSPVTRTYTQPAVTRDANGAVVTRPALTVA